MIADHRTLIVDLTNGVVTVGIRRPDATRHDRFACRVATLGAASFTTPKNVGESYWRAVLGHVALARLN